MQEFKDAFAVYGADYEATMGRFMGSQPMYLRFLDMFFQDESLQKLGAALDGGDLNAAFEAAHTLKGTSGNMGLAPLYTAVCTIVEPLRAGTVRGDYPALYQAIQEEYQKADAFRQSLKKGGPV